MTASHVNDRVRKYRQSLRMAGLRPIQIWVPDTQQPNFGKECHRQSMLAAQADAMDTETSTLLDEALSDIEGWKE
ncbi:antitoxin MazE family protein [Pollutimonas sp. M17]|uniref:antitoxin MazE family protein n=1 Tax=Pollutimonas sp. M17 TaxID=2962065 RepID=UPI0021F4D1EF|nr:antitoxin MazE family protein [Pollutimonas sp. M17]UYO94967.1 antitoxin MazE family protein [Pollutimonas sp. M17]